MSEDILSCHNWQRGVLPAPMGEARDLLNIF